MDRDDIPFLTLCTGGIGDIAAPVTLADFAPSGNVSFHLQDASSGGWEQFCQDGTAGLRMPAPDMPGPVFLCGTCASALDITRYLVHKGQFPVWGSVLASEQTAGRGQLGRHWYSPRGNILAAIRLPSTEPFDGTAASAAVGSFLAATLRSLGYPVLLKWPNDLCAMIDEEPHKTGGILLEERESCLVAGIGINVTAAPPVEELREGHALPGGCLAATGAMQTPGTIPLWLKLVNGLNSWYKRSLQADKSCTSGTTPLWRREAEHHLVYMGQTVAITDGPDDSVRHEGVVIGLADDGGLQLYDNGCIQSVYSGSLVPCQEHSRA